MVAETLNSFFSDAPRNLDIEENPYLLNPTEGLTDPIDIALRKFESHPSILKIKENVSMSLFNFNAIRLDVVLEVRNINPNKASTSDNIPVKSLKENYDICRKVLHPIINKAIL